MKSTIWERMKRLVGLSPKANYEGGQVNKRNRYWQPKNRSNDYFVRQSFELLAARGRDLGRNHPLCVGAKRVFVDNIIGEGIQSKACVLNENSGELDETFNLKADQLYAEWSDRAHVNDQYSLAEMLRINLENVIEVGDGFLIEVASDDPTRRVPICFIGIERDQLDLSKDRARGQEQNEIRNGVELDDMGRIVAYHFYERHPRDINSSFAAMNSTRIPAERVIHLRRTSRFSSVLGVSWFAPLMMPLWNLMEYTKSEIEAAKIASFFTVVEKRDNYATGLGHISESRDDDDSYTNDLRLGPGLVTTMGVNDDIEIVQSNRPNSQATAWLNYLLQLMAQGIGLSVPRFTNDFTRTNFSSSRAADLQDRKHFKPLQRWHAWHVDLEIRRRVTRQLIALGELPVPIGGVVRFNRNPERWLAAKVSPPGWGYVDPQKQIAAADLAVRSGLSTYTRELAEVGLDFDEVMIERQREKRRSESLGVPLPAYADPFDESPGRSPEPAPARRDEDEDDEEEDQEDEE